MKRIFSLLLALVMLASLTACGKGGLSLKPGGGDGDSDSSPSANSGDRNSDAPGGDSNTDAPGGDDGDVIYPEDGLAVGYEGDTLRTAWFDMKIENPQTYDEFDGLTPDAGYKFLTVELTVYNYTNWSCVMYDTDFEIIWDMDDDDAWDYPVYDEYQNENGETEYSVRSDKQLPIEYTVGIHKSQTGLLLYQVPVDSTDFFIYFYEEFAPEEEGGESRYGDDFLILFSA